MKEIVVTSNLAKSLEYKMNLVLMMQGRKIRWLFTLAFLPAIFLITFFKEVWFPAPQGSSNGSLYSLIVFVVFAAVIFGIPYLKTYQRKISPVYTFDHWGMRVTVNDTTTNLQWSEIGYYMEVPEYIVICLRKGLLNNEIIPKADFKTREDWQQLTDMLNENCVKNKPVVR